ncbi:hypothetical protein NE237_027777 [Protea cynaroides]|uniref:LOB domain-containing protein n=1 Tax=Protea cynaroides TaxID=273540 RepID=A0A9Q0JUI7_9MAGN|nr:hypothetical protein NE237_027777 [Protea cynaroides]
MIDVLLFVKMNEKKGKGSSQACAACKHQRRKCSKQSCLLAPYFPVSEYQDFLNAQKLFGVSNITKILNQIEPDQRREAINSIVIESKARKDDPVKGIVGIINKLQSQIQLRERELAIVKQQLTYCQQREKLIYLKQKEQIEQLQSQQQLLHLLASSSSSTSSQLLHQFDDSHCQLPGFLDSGNIESYTGRDMNVLNQGCTYSSTLSEYEDIKPLLDYKTSALHNRTPINFKDAGESRFEVTIETLYA